MGLPFPRGIPFPCTSALHGTDDPAVTQVATDADSKLFRDELDHPQHTLHQLIAEQMPHDYEL